MRVVEPHLAALQFDTVLGEQDLLLRVAEAQQGSDLNGDGDRNDSVLQHVDLLSGLVTNMGVGLVPVEPIQERRCLLFANEAETATDWNGDGDLSDAVLQLWDASSTTLTNSGLAAGAGTPVLVGGVAAFSVSEASQGRDLDGDGDLLDHVVHVWHVGSAAPRNLGLGLPILPRLPVGGFELAVDRTSVLFPVSEAGVGDLDGDGDELDKVLHVYDIASQSVQNLGLALVPSNFLHGSRNLIAEGTIAAFLVSESAQGGRDLNGDGDALDQVVHVYDPAFGVSNLRFASEQVVIFGPGIPTSGFFRIVGERVLFNVWESAQGASDLNGDGDALDLLLYAHRRGVPGAKSLGVPGGFIYASEQAVAYPRYETRDGQDLNGDGDQDDEVLFLRRFDRDASQNTRLAVLSNGIDTLFFGGEPAGEPSCVGLGGDWVYAVVSEGDQGNVDLNGDGDAADIVLLVLDSRTLSIRGAPQAVNYPGLGEPRFECDMLTFAVSERDQGGRDLNGDGDALDEVVHVVSPAWDRAVNTGLCTVSFFPRALTGVGRARRVLRAEWLEGQDLNLDGDQSDSVVQALVIGPRYR